MKRLIAIISMLFLLPLSASALTMMDDSQMNDVTAQAGVTIALDVHLDLDVDTVAWGDDGIDIDGDGTNDTSGGWIGIKDMAANLFVGLRTDINITDGGWADAAMLTIDVATDDSGATDALYGGATFVRIGLGTLEVSGDMSMSLALADDAMDATPDLDQVLGNVIMDGMRIRFEKGGYVDISAEDRTGVTLGLHVLMDEIHMDLMTWGDGDAIDHVLAGATANGFAANGFIGLSALDIVDLDINGKVGIDVLTMTTTGLDLLTNDTNTLYHAYDPLTQYQQATVQKLAYVAANAGGISPTMVMLTLGEADGVADLTGDGDLIVNMGSLSANCIVGTSVSGVNTTTGTLGSIYIGDANVAVDGLVAIGAH